MIDRNLIHDNMEVMASDGSIVGRVDGLDADRIKLERNDSADHRHHFIPLEWVDRVDTHVHLNRDRAAVAALGGTPDRAATGTARATSAGLAGKGLLWPLLALVALVILVLAVTQCHRDGRVNTADNSNPVVVPAVPGAPLEQGTLAYDLDRFLSGKDGTPRTFTLDRLNFNPGTAEIRDVDRAGLDDVARVFAAYPNARAAVVGYTDSVGPAAQNSQLGADRARAVVAALEARGVPAKRIEARTGGENNPVATNMTPSGQFENRRSELVILKR